MVTVYKEVDYNDLFVSHEWQVSAVNHSEEHKLGIREIAAVEG